MDRRPPRPTRTDTLFPYTTLVRSMAPHAAEVIASDLSSEMIAAVVREAAQRDIGNIATVKAAAESLPFDSGHFDAVVSRFSAHHWGDLTGGLREAARVLKAEIGRAHV